MEKIYTCEYCNTTNQETNSRGGCIACGAPIKKENIEIKENYQERNYSINNYIIPANVGYYSSRPTPYFVSSGSCRSSW